MRKGTSPKRSTASLAASWNESWTALERRGMKDDVLAKVALLKGLARRLEGGEVGPQVFEGRHRHLLERGSAEPRLVSNHDPGGSAGQWSRLGRPEGEPSERTDPPTCGRRERSLLIVGTAIAPDDGVTHHLVRANSGAGDLRRIRPLLPADSRIDTCALYCWRMRHGELPQDLMALERPTKRERDLVAAGGGRIITRAKSARRQPP